MLLLLLAACDLMGHDCNLMWAPSNTTVRFEVSSEATWSWSVEGDTVDLACSVTLPDASDALCEGSAPMPDVQVTDTGWILTSSAEEGGDATLHVQVWRDDELVLDETITPEWQVDEPNGKGCGERYTYDQTWTIE